MSRPINDLSDFLTALYGLSDAQLPAADRMQTAKQLYFDFVQRVGIEFCNFGAFELREGVGQFNEFSGANLSAAFLDEYVGEAMYEEDAILLRGQQLTAARQTDIFEIGRDALAGLPDAPSRQREVMSRSADAGMAHGLAIVGKSQVAPDERDERFFGFVFGGDRSALTAAKTHFSELHIATFALLQALKPEFEAMREGFAFNLTDRERQMLGDLALGKTRDQMAFDSNLSIATVDMHLRNLRRKLKAQTLAKAVAKGFRFGLL